MKVTVVGAGLAGATAAAFLSRAGHDVTVFETRPHIGGNCYDSLRHDGTRVHEYGPHIFHTDYEDVWTFLNQFTSFNNYEHKVMADTVLGRIPIPFNRVSESIIGELTDYQVRDLLYVDYSEKMWGMPWKQLPSTIISRVPARRDNDDCRYFTDRYQGIPVKGFTSMFESMFSDSRIYFGAGKDDWRRSQYDLLVYTGPLDEYYECHIGRLGYKTLNFVYKPKAANEEFPVAVINQCNHVKSYTRSTDNSFWHDCGDRTGKGVIVEEYPCDAEPGDIPFYPIPYGTDARTACQYRALDAGTNVIFLGRLATYLYLNMDQVVHQTLSQLGHLA